MYVNNKVSIKISSSNINYYKEKYPNIHIGDNIYVYIEELSKSSSALIRVKCDNCKCEKSIKYKYYKLYGYSDGYYLCRKCKLSQNLKNKYNVENVFQITDIKDKIKKTVQNKYNVDNVSQLNSIKRKKEKTWSNKSDDEKEDIKKKRKNTIKLKYNVDNVSQLDSIKRKKEKTWNNKSDDEKEKILKKRIETVQKKYKKDYIFQIESIKEQIKKTNIKLYGVENVLSNKDIRKKAIKSSIEALNKKTKLKNPNIIKINEETFTIKCEICNQNFNINKILYYKRNETKTTICTNCNPINKNISGLEIQFINFIEKNYNGIILKNDRKIINPYELDIYLPELKLAFEFNGVYWHNELYKSKNYHYNKTLKCRNKNIQLIHIWEDDWIYNKDIIISMILNKLNKTNKKIFARKTEIKTITDNSIVSEFLNKNHIQGYAKSSIKIGLLYDNELVSLMTFKKSKDNSYELNRFCNIINTNVIGSASKLFKYFLNNFKFNTITTFSDNSYSYGNLYEKLGFKIYKELKADYSYVLNDKRIHKFNFRKKNLQKIFGHIDDTEHNICLKHNIYRIYDSGKLKWIYKK